MQYEIHINCWNIFFLYICCLLCNPITIPQGCVGEQTFLQTESYTATARNSTVRIDPQCLCHHSFNQFSNATFKIKWGWVWVPTQDRVTRSHTTILNLASSGSNTRNFSVSLKYHTDSLYENIPMFWFVITIVNLLSTSWK